MQAREATHQSNGAGVHPEVVGVTGASAGVGRAVAHAFARKGARVGLIARDESGLEAARLECLRLGGEAVVLPTDVACPEAVEAAAARLEEAFGPLDVWVNDAMATVFSEFLDIDPGEFRRATEVTYLGCVHGTLSALRRMVPRDHGTVVQVGSALSYRAIPLQAAYCGSKFAIRGFTDSVRTELMHHQSRVWLTMVQLPAVNTPQFSWCRTHLPHHPAPVAPIYQPEVAAQAVYGAAHRRRREIWCGGSAVKAILGNTVAPWYADRVLARSGYEAQQLASVPVSPGRRDNLEHPVPEHAATHGMFDDVARRGSVQLMLTLHRSAAAAVAAGAATVLGGAAVASLLRRR